MRQEPVIRNRAFGHRSNLSKSVKSRNRRLTRRERRGPFRTVDRVFKDFTVCVRDATGSYYPALASRRLESAAQSSKMGCAASLVVESPAEVL